MHILPTYTEGVYTPEQLNNLHHLDGFAQRWFWWEVGEKRPMNPAGGMGKVSDPTTAGTLAAALDAMQRNSGGGVGLLVSAGVSGLVGVDIDSVIHDGEIHPLGVAALERFAGGYVEVSPSSTGLRIFCTGVIPKDTPKGSTAIGQSHHGKEIKFEIYAAGGAGRFLRTTGATIQGTAGGVGPCPAGIAWLAGEMSAARSSQGAGLVSASSPDKGSDQGMTLDAVFAELAALRPEIEEPAEIIAAIQANAGEKSRSKLAAVWSGKLGPFNGDHSTADLFMCCEAIRRGAGHVVDVVAVWRASGLSSRDKFQRKAYQTSSIDAAARAVLRDMQRKAGKSGDVSKAIVLPEQLAAAITESGDKLTLTKGGRPEATASNVVVLFRNDPRLLGLLAFNELAQRAERVGPWTVFDRGACVKVGPLSDDDLTRAAMWLASEMGMKMDHRDLMRGLDAAAMDARFDPLADRLRALGAAWDGVPRVGSWLTKYARIDAADCAEYVEAVGRCFLVGAVARALQPACQMDTVLAVEGVGGARKSTMFKVLADSVADGLFADGVHDVSNPVALVEGTSGRWIVELAELAGIRRAQDVEALKAAITRREDLHRRPYALMPRDYPRRFVFVATTNRTEYLSDPTGALLRRFWPVRTLATESDPIDCDALAAVAAQIWGEAVRLYQSGTPWHLSPSDGKAYTQWEAGRELRREDGAFHDEVVSYVVTDWFEFYPEGRALVVIARAVGDMRTVEGDQGSRNRLADTLRTLDMESVKRGGKKLWFITPKAYRRFFDMREQAKLDKVEQAGKPTGKPAKVGAK